MRPPNQDPFEEQYLDVLQNIEFALVSTYKGHRDMIDADANAAISGLIRLYQAEQRGKSVPELRLSPIAQTAFNRVQIMCEWRLGRAKAPVDLGDDAPEAKAKSIDEMILCLKRIRKSIETWNKEYGRRGYYEFVSQFVQ